MLFMWDFKTFIHFYSVYFSCLYWIDMYEIFVSHFYYTRLLTLYQGTIKCWNFAILALQNKTVQMFLTVLCFACDIVILQRLQHCRDVISVWLMDLSASDRQKRIYQICQLLSALFGWDLLGLAGVFGCSYQYVDFRQVSPLCHGG